MCDEKDDGGMVMLAWTTIAMFAFVAGLITGWLM
jgi:hypothetical protein